MLRWSAQTTNRHFDLRAIVKPSIDPLIPGGRALIGLGRSAAAITEPDATAVERVASELGGQAATDAAAVATAFEGLNRIVDGVGLPVSKASRRDRGDLIELLGLEGFPHAH